MSEFKYGPIGDELTVESRDGTINLSIDPLSVYSSSLYFINIEDFGKFIDWLQTVHGQIHTESTQTK